MSVCLNHQDRETDRRCVACLKPICAECTLETPTGRFCSETCRDNAARSAERNAELKARDEAARAAARHASLVRAAVALALLAALGLGALMLRPALPSAVRAPVARFLQTLGK